MNKFFPVLLGLLLTICIAVTSARSNAAELISQAQEAPLPSLLLNDFSGFTALSGNGRFVVFQTRATNLLVDSDTSSFGFYLHDQNSGQAELLLGHANASLGGARFVAEDSGLLFFSRASNLLDAESDAEPFEQGRVYIYWIDSKEVIEFDPSGLLNGKNAVFAGDGKLAAYTETMADDSYELVLYDRTTGKLRSAAQHSNQALTLGSFSANGRYLTLSTHASNLNLSDTDNDTDSYLLDTKNLAVSLLGATLTRQVTPLWINANGNLVLLRVREENFPELGHRINSPYLWVLLDRGSGELKPLDIPRLPLETGCIYPRGIKFGG